MKAAEFYKELCERQKNGCDVAAATVIGGEHAGEKFFLSEEEQDGEKEKHLFVETFCPPAQIVICGGGHISAALEKILKFLGYKIMICDDRKEFADKKRFSLADEVYHIDFETQFCPEMFGTNTSYIVVTRGHRDDLTCLRKILAADSQFASEKKQIGYIGMIGSRKKVEQVFERLEREGISREQLGKVHAPIGLKIGAKTPEEIAVSIAAELIQYFSQRKGYRINKEIAQNIGKEKREVMVTVMEASGSTPGKTGSRMLVTQKACYGTIGGGKSEYELLQKARQKITENDDQFETLRCQLTNEGAASLGMICGGEMQVCMEPLWENIKRHGKI
ncbi:MAG: XdhC family protein [Eubacteriales bacterium]|nr:XdhC family protein [Eubacteriales bacterium]